jgi:hypothetical protein
VRTGATEQTETFISSLVCHHEFSFQEARLTLPEIRKEKNSISISSNQVIFSSKYQQIKKFSMMVCE